MIELETDRRSLIVFGSLGLGRGRYFESRLD